MSTDLQLLHDLPKPRSSSSSSSSSSFSAVKIELPSDEDDRVTTTITTEAAEMAEIRRDGGGGGDDDQDQDDASCRTPTSKESRIPEVLTCPPAPKKTNRVVSCKRKLLEEFQMFEKVNKDEIDGFFRSNFPKRSCRCT